MTQKAYCSGSEYPELKKDTLRIYSNRICPYAERARLVLAHKNIPHEVVNINLKDKPDWFLARAPEGKVPVLHYNDTILWESTAVSEYLDDVHSPDNKLQAQDPLRKAQDRILLEHFGQVSSQFYGILLNLRHEDKHATFGEKADLLRQGYRYYDQHLADRGTTFFGGSSPGMLDYFLWPHLERVPTLVKMVPNHQVAISQSECPNLAAWWNAMTQVPAVKKEMKPTEWHLEVYRLMQSGENSYDVGLEE